ncbi:hypothetical protein J5N97_011332 [Dioscorea zingiberensis]|uniref:Uncharacterized protein n=1 Tax=Dioscorea zingiberensis TaxID=325984 RepID=A0A9D5D266_9LILI|nr:hypothetical protein J5N97_011332 [Dioscorea zingiberensis]
MVLRMEGIEDSGRKRIGPENGSPTVNSKHHLTVKILKIPEDLHFVLRMRHMFESLGYQTDTNGVLVGLVSGVIMLHYRLQLTSTLKYAQVVYEVGCGDVKCKNDSLIWLAVKAAKSADATVIITGLNLDIESEGNDRSDLELPD